MRVSLSWSAAILGMLVAVVSLSTQSYLQAQGSALGGGTQYGAGTGASGGSALGGNSAGGGVTPGGAAMADFDTLINLIQQTIDPDSWLAAGGTSTILQYPSGVFVDAKGHVKRLRETENLLADFLNPIGDPQTRHPWKTESKLRTISLRKLEAALLHTATEGLAPTNELLRLAGLSKIKYVKIDVGNEDILIAGPAGDQGLGFELQDLAVVAALINSNTNPLGCSIEPADKGILAAQTMLQERGAIARLGRNPRLVVEQMQEKIGAHNVRVFGMQPNTGTALALIDADEHMKKVGFGTVQTRTPVNSYFDYLDRQPKVPSQSLIRWWFSFADQPVRVNQAKDLFELPEECVAVFSEQQWVSQQGRAPTGQNDKAADAFAEGFSKHLARMRKTHPSYARLTAVFETALALQLAVESTGLPSLQPWFPNLCRLGVEAPKENSVPQTVDGLTTWHKLKNGTIVAVVSGGVKVDTLELAANDNWQESKFLVSSLVSEPTGHISSAHGNWWWD